MPDLFLLLRVSVPLWWIFPAALIGFMCSNLAYVLFRAELLGWQKRRQARFLHEQAMLFAVELDKHLQSEPLQFPKTQSLFVDGTKLKPRQLKRMIERLVNEDDRRFFSSEGGGNH